MENIYLSFFKEQHNKLEMQTRNLGLHYFQSDGMDDTGFSRFEKVTDSSPDHHKISFEYIENVKILIERCILMYMEEKEVVETLSNREKINPIVTKMVWERLAKYNPEFFRAYYQRLEVIRQILYFNQLLEHQYPAMKAAELPSEPEQNTIHQPTHVQPMLAPDNGVELEYSEIPWDFGADLGALEGDQALRLSPSGSDMVLEYLEQEKTLDLGSLEGDQPLSPSGSDMVLEYLEQEKTLGQVDFVDGLIQTPPFFYPEMDDQHPGFK